MSKKKITVVERAAELLRNNPNLKHYQAMEQARRDLGEMDRGRISRLSGQEK